MSRTIKTTTMNRGLNSGTLNKKGQITIFIIVGIVLLFSSALILYIREKSVVGIPPQVIDNIEQVPIEQRPVKLFVEQCLYSTAKDAIKKVGSHGGYVDPLNQELSGRSMKTNLVEPTESDLVAIWKYPITDARQDFIPYWYYMTTPNSCSTCSFGSLQPTLTKPNENSIERQLEKEIDSTLNDCLREFIELKNVGYTLDSQQVPLSQVTVTQKDVAVMLKYPVRFKKGDMIVDVDKFYSKIDVHLKELYDLGSAIVIEELNAGSLERGVMNTIVPFTALNGVDSKNSIPGIGEITFDLSDYKVWTIPDVKEKLERHLLPTAMSRFKVDRARNFKSLVIANSNNFTQGYADTFTFPLEQVSNDTYFSHADAEFQYLDFWPSYLTINGQKSVVMPDRFDMKVIPLGMIRYKGFYDLSYPVLVTLRDREAFLGEGFEFMFFIEVNVRNNRQIDQNMSQGGFLSGSLPQYECTRSNFVGGPLNLTVVDKYTKEPISGAIVSVAFGTSSCYIGKTDIDGKINSPVPVGIGALLVSKTDYMEFGSPFGAFLNTSQVRTVELMKEFEIPATVAKIQLQYVQSEDADEAKKMGPDKGNAYYKGKFIMGSAEPAPLSAFENETAMVLLTRINDDSFLGYNTVLISNQEKRVYDTFRIIPGTYKVEGMLFAQGAHIIKGGVLEEAGVFGPDEDIVLDDVKMDSVNHGGMKFVNTTGYLEITAEDLVGTKRITFVMLSLPLPGVVTRELGDQSDLSDAGNIEGFTKAYQEYLKPIYTK